MDELLLLLRENERGWVGGAVRIMLVLPISLSSLSLGEGGGEAVLLRRRKTPLPLPLVTGVELVVALGDAGRTIIDVLHSGSDDCAPWKSRAVSSDDSGSPIPHESAGPTAAFAISSSRCFFFLIAKSFNDIFTFGVT